MTDNLPGPRPLRDLPPRYALVRTEREARRGALVLTLLVLGSLAAGAAGVWLAGVLQ